LRTCNHLVFLDATPQPTSVFKAGKVALHLPSRHTTTAALHTPPEQTPQPGLHLPASRTRSKTTSKSATRSPNTSSHAPLLCLLASHLLRRHMSLHPAVVLLALLLASAAAVTQMATSPAGNCPARDSPSRALIRHRRPAGAVWLAMCTTCLTLRIRRSGRAKMKARDRWMRGRGKDCFRLVLISRDGKMMYWNVTGLVRLFLFDVHVFAKAISWFWDGSIFHHSFFFSYSLLFPRGNPSVNPLVKLTEDGLWL